MHAHVELALLFLIAVFSLLSTEYWSLFRDSVVAALTRVDLSNWPSYTPPFRLDQVCGP